MVIVVLMHQSVQWLHHDVKQLHQDASLTPRSQSLQRVPRYFQWVNVRKTDSRGGAGTRRNSEWNYQKTSAPLRLCGIHLSWHGLEEENLPLRRRDAEES